MRFYPPEIAAFEHEPTRDRFEIQRVSPDVGEGVVGLARFEPGEIVFRFSGHLVPDFTQYSLQVGAGLHMHDPWFMGKVLHHCDPNCDVDVAARQFVARRAIEQGELVTMDYDQTEDVLFRTFICRCGAPSCRGEIRGRLVRTAGMRGAPSLAGYAPPTHRSLR